MAALETGPGWVRVAAASGAPEPVAAQAGAEGRPWFPSSLVFAHLQLDAPVEIRADSVNALADRVAEDFFEAVRGERIEVAWPCIWRGPAGEVGLGRRISAVESAFGIRLKRRLARVAKLARPDLPRGVGPVHGLFVFFADFGRLFVSRAAFVQGQQRMADDELAPSRSYLKVEEAYIVLGREPQAGETVCDLGAAPGGWAYSAARRGAQVVAVDNGPLKGGADGHPRIDHRREDAFGFTPGPGGFDWLFCDLVEEPHHVLQHLVEPWLAQSWCRRFVVNLKFGRVDPIALLRELESPVSPLTRHAAGLRIRHLYHDREEFTVVGWTKR